MRNHFGLTGRGMRAFVVGLVATGLVGGLLMLRAQEPPEPPEAPEPLEAPEADQFFLFNDDAAHLGVTLHDITAEKARELKLPAATGALVVTVQKNSAAAKAGLKAGDVISEFDGEHVRSSAELRRLIRETPPDRTVAIKIVRDGSPSVLNAKLERPDHQLSMLGPEPQLRNAPVRIEPPDVPQGPFFFEFQGTRLGISADDLTPQLAQYFGVKQGKGVLVSEVTVGSAAAKAGLKAGDVIVEVDGKSVATVNELRSALNEKSTEEPRKVRLTIVRDHQQQSITTELTHQQNREKRAMNLGGPEFAQAIVDLQAQSAQLREQLAKQKEFMNDAWQRQLREQMRTLQKELPQQLEQLKQLQVVPRQDNEI